MGASPEDPLQPAAVAVADVSPLSSMSSSSSGSSASDVYYNMIPAVWTQAPDGSRPGNPPAAKALARHITSDSSSSICSSGSSSVSSSSGGSSSSSSSSSVSRSLRKIAATAQQPLAAVARPPAKAVRRIVWDRQMQLRAFWLTVFFCVLAFFWGWRFQMFSRGPKRALYGWSLPVAKACGNAMKIVIWPVLILPLSYVFTTPLRLTWLDRFVPFDFVVPFHMLVAVIGGILAIVHASCHMLDYLHAARQSAALWSAAYPGTSQPLSFWHQLYQSSTGTGLLMLTVLSVVFLFALPYPKKAAWLKGTAVGRVLNNYDWFWTTHKIGLFVFYTALVLHPLPGALRRVENPFAFNVSPLEWGYSDTWVWVSIPLLIRLADRGIRWWRRNLRPSRILGAEFMGDDLVALRFTRPKGFHFRPGMYIYLCMPAASQLQWHPISLAGSPSADSLAVLVSNSGNWANSLHELLRRQLEAATPTEFKMAPSAPLLSTLGPLREQFQLHQDSKQQATQAEALSKLELLIDGPFGAPAVAYSRFPVVLLVGAGVGVTPFLSMLADAVEQHAQQVADAAKHSWCSGGAFCGPACARAKLRARRPVQKVHFHWLVREPTVPRWLRQTLQTAAAADASHLLDINVHQTKAMSRSHSLASLSKALGKESMASDLDAAERAAPGSGSCLPGGSVIKSWHGRPDFEATFKQLGQAHPGTQIGVFYCGPPGLAKTLSALCIRHSAASKANFHFRAERF